MSLVREELCKNSGLGIFILFLSVVTRRSEREETFRFLSHSHWFS